eukprot:scaffold82986_cov51-Phaeocystis_antarctica.AAC.3
MAAMTRKTMATPKVTKMPVRCFIITWWRVRVRGWGWGWSYGYGELGLGLAHRHRAVDAAGGPLQRQPVAVLSTAGLTRVSSRPAWDPVCWSGVRALRGIPRWRTRRRTQYRAIGPWYTRPRCSRSGLGLGVG